MSRRSLYCSKWANGPRSIVDSFTDDTGNIWFEPLGHTWTDDKCSYCGAGRRTLDRDEGLETHAYAFIHSDDINKRINELFGGDMHFDVIVGNPPYQLSDGGHGASALPIYHRFVETAKRLDPRFLSMIIPSRWFAGGRGLDDFRREMLTDDRIRVLVDYLDSRECFPTVDVAGGVCYFLWNRDHRGDCEVVSHAKRGVPARATRPLLEPGADVFVRYNEGLPILKKVVFVEAGSETDRLELADDRRFSRQVSSQKPFGLRTFFRGDAAKQRANDVRVLQSGGEGWTRRSKVTDGVEHIDKWKVFTSKSSSEHAGQTDSDGRRRVLSKSGVLPPGTVVTETYVLLGTFDTEREAKNCFSYVRTRLFRFLIILRSSSQDISRSAYGFVPVQDFTEPWADETLYAKYGITEGEAAVIESLIRPMDVG
jgi:site-specific DNA-methyltransferase (adenine-specific)